MTAAAIAFAVLLLVGLVLALASGGGGEADDAIDHGVGAQRHTWRRVVSGLGEPGPFGPHVLVEPFDGRWCVKTMAKPGLAVGIQRLVDTLEEAKSQALVIADGDEGAVLIARPGPGPSAT